MTNNKVKKFLFALKILEIHFRVLKKLQISKK